MDDSVQLSVTHIGDTCLHDAAYNNQPDTIDALVSRGVPIDAVDNNQRSALHIAVQQQNLECVRTLLRLNCNVNLQNDKGYTALHYAVILESDKIVRTLCSSGRVDFGIQNMFGFNVLHYSAAKGNAFAMQHLVLKAPHLVDVRAKNGLTPLHLAADHGHRNVAATLLSHQGGKAQINLQNKALLTPLQVATLRGHWSLVELLLQYNADMTIKGGKGNTALHIAIYECENQANIEPTADDRNNAPQIYTVWQELSRRGARTELALACFLVSQDTSETILEQARNSINQAPIGILASDSKLAPFKNIVRSYKGQKQRLYRDSLINYDGSSQFEVFQIYKQTFQDSQLHTDELERRLESEKTKNERLQTRIEHFEELHLCRICLEERRDVTFFCGHGACKQCFRAGRLTTCHMCRQTIILKTDLY